MSKLSVRQKVGECTDYAFTILLPIAGFTFAGFDIAKTHNYIADTLVVVVWTVALIVGVALQRLKARTQGYVEGVEAVEDWISTYERQHPTKPRKNARSSK